MKMFKAKSDTGEDRGLRCVDEIANALIEKQGLDSAKYGLMLVADCARTRRLSHTYCFT